jgi:hypothetical protein
MIMKKFLISILAILISLATSAQMGKVTSALAYMDQGLLDKAKEALDQALRMINQRIIPRHILPREDFARRYSDQKIQNSRH